MPADIRWIQRFNNFKKAFSQLEEAEKLAQQRPLSKLEEQGCIQAFEYTHELAWKTLKDFLENRGVKTGLIGNGDIWMDMLLSRNLTSHTYDDTTADNIVSAIHSDYFSEFRALKAKLDVLKQEEGQ